MNIAKKIQSMLNAPTVEPYSIEKINRDTMETETIHIIPTCTGGVAYTPYRGQF